MPLDFRIPVRGNPCKACQQNPLPEASFIKDECGEEAEPAAQDKGEAAHDKEEAHDEEEAHYQEKQPVAMTIDEATWNSMYEET